MHQDSDRVTSANIPLKLDSAVYAADVRQREKLADLSHDIWAHWMRWQFYCCTQNEDGSMTIPASKVKRWQRQMKTSYQDLSEKEKDSDREQADKILQVLRSDGEST